MAGKVWKLFLDDERMPSKACGDYIIARNSYDAIWMIENYGMPTTIAFDHDLGGQDTAMTVVRYITEWILNDKQLPNNFSYTVHSQNPVGAENIRSAMNTILDFYREQEE